MRTFKPANYYSSRTKHWLFVVVVLVAILPIIQGTAAELGQTREAVIARHGYPQRDDDQGVIYYQWDAWTLGIKFLNGAASRLAYGKTDVLSESDILGILTANGGKDAWTQAGEKLWMRSDGATATWGTPDGHKLILQSKNQGTPAQPAPPARTPAFAPTPPLIDAAALNPFRFAPATRSSGSNRMEIPALNIWPFFLVCLGLAIFVFLAKSWKRSRPYFARCATNSDVSPSQHFFVPTPITVRPASNSSVPEPSPPPTTPPPPFTPSPCPPPSHATIESVTWDQFELVIAEIYRRQGYLVEVSSGLGADGGIDVKLQRDGEVTLVQCKHWKAWKVSVKNIREFFGTMVHEEAQRGIFVSTKEYTRDCRAFIIGKPIDLLGRTDIESMVRDAQYPGENIWDVSQWIAGFEATARITTPTCPYCHETMVLRYTKNHEPLWGCPSYPGCRGKRDVRHELLNSKSW